MNKRLFYTVEKENYSEGSFNGLETLTVYEIKEDIPRIFCSIDTWSDSPYAYEEEIQEWLDDNGYGDEEFEFYKL